MSLHRVYKGDFGLNSEKNSVPSWSMSMLEAQIEDESAPVSILAGTFLMPFISINSVEPIMFMEDIIT